MNDTNVNEQVSESQIDLKLKNETEDTNVANHEFRTILPSKMVDRGQLSIWSILKQCVDKELYRFTIPIIWNEPLSLLQRMAENIKYADELLDKAANSPNPIDRMKYLAGFLISSTSVHACRLSKPFNPLLGETYEYVCKKNNFRICCEQVSHHPPISAYYSESIKPSKSSAKWKYYGSVNPQMKLNLLHACVEAYPEGIQTVEFPELGEVYTWQNLKISAHNLILGKLWFEYTGRTEIINHKLNIKCILEFKPYSWFVRQVNRVEGYIVDSNDNKVALLNGKWDEFFYATNKVDNINEFFKNTEKLIEIDTNVNNKKNSSYSLKNDIELIWKAEDSLIIKPDYYNFTNFTLTLNELYDTLTKPVFISISKDDKITTSNDNDSSIKKISLGPLPLTDSRFRTDLRLFENGQIEIASSEKNRLEEKQRETQRKVESGELPEWKPLWFGKSQHSIVNQEETWTFNQKYWQRDFTLCPNIF